MDYEKKYKDALEAMRVFIYPRLDGDAKLAAEKSFPELAESEDERIRKMVIGAVNFAASAKGGLLHSEASECLSWLEEQKDKNCLACDQHLKGYLAGRKVTEEEKQKEQKPAEWSEEDVKRLYSIGTQIGFLKGKYSEYQKDIDWLHALAEKMGYHKCKTGEVVTEWKKEDIDDKMLSKPKQE